MPRIRCSTIVRVVLCAAPGLPGPGVLAAQECSSARLALEARATLPLPPTFGIEGIVPGLEGSLILWSKGGELLVVNGSRTVTTHQLPDSISLAGVAPAPEGYRVLDRTGQEYLLGTGGELTTGKRIALARGELLDQALWQDGRWILGVRDLEGLRFVLRWAGQGRVLYRSGRADSARAVPRFQLTPVRGGLLLTGVTAPFPLLSIDLATAKAKSWAHPLGPEPGTGGSIPADSLQNWRALPAVALDCGVVVTLADLAGERRLLVRYTPQGSVAQVTPVDARFGLVASLPQSQLLGARRAGDLELVWYDWRWVREAGPPSR